MYALKHGGCVGDSHQDPRIPESNLEASKMPFLSQLAASRLPKSALESRKTVPNGRQEGPREGSARTSRRFGGPQRAPRDALGGGQSAVEQINIREKSSGLGGIHEPQWSRPRCSGAYQLAKSLFSK